MTVPDYRDPRLTEQRNPRTERIDVASTLEIVDLLNAEDATVAGAVRAVRAELARAIDLVVDALGRGGRLIYVGAGTSGRLGVLDASECPPTFGTPPEMVVGVIAGGYPALVKSSEGAEDDVNAGMAAMDQARVTPADFVLGIAASGTTPFVRAALSRAQTIGAATGLVSCSDPPRVLVETCDVLVLPKVGPEALTGSTRMKAGTATKLVLNTLSTGAMIRLGRAYGNLMVDLMALSDKLRDRGERIVMECCNVDRAAARGAIEAAGGSVKLAIVMARRGVRKAEAERLLAEAGGVVRKAAGHPPPVSPPWPRPSPSASCRARRSTAFRRRSCGSPSSPSTHSSSRSARTPTRRRSAGRSSRRSRAAARRIWLCCTLPWGNASRGRCCSSWPRRRSRPGTCPSSRRMDRPSGTSRAAPHCSWAIRP